MPINLLPTLIISLYNKLLSLFKLLVFGLSCITASFHSKGRKVKEIKLEEKFV